MIRRRCRTCAPPRSTSTRCTAAGQPARPSSTRRTRPSEARRPAHRQQPPTRGAVDLPRGATRPGAARRPAQRREPHRRLAAHHLPALPQPVGRSARPRAPRLAERAGLPEAQRQVRLHYQWAVLTDFLPQVVGQDARRRSPRSSPARHRHPPHASQTPPRLTVYNPCTTGIPVEFSVAAYRFGHSMVRPIYRINTTVADRLPVFSLTNDPTKDLVGFRPSPSNFAHRLELLLPDGWPATDRQAPGVVQAR